MNGQEVKVEEYKGRVVLLSKKYIIIIKF